MSREVEDSPALFFAHRFYPGAVSLQAQHLAGQHSAGVVMLQVGEEELWRYLVQLVSAMRGVHKAGRFLRGGGLHPSKVLLVGRGRIRVGAIGVLDVLHGEAHDDPRVFQVNSTEKNTWEHPPLLRYILRME